MNSSADRSLLFGILAWQNGFIATEPLLTAIRTWLHEKSKQLGEVLVQQGDLSAQQRALLEQLIDARVQQDGGDAGQSLANLSSSLPFADKLAAMHDDALAASLAKLPPAVHRAWPGSDSESHSSSESRQSDESAASDDGLHLILDRFEAAWREHVNAKDKSEEGKSALPPVPGLEKFLREVPDKQQKIALRELLIIELHWRRKNGETPEHKSYQRRFPDWSHVVDNAFNLANGRYQVKESFAKGGLGEVFIARDLELNRPVAFKCVRADRDREESRKRLVIEGEITGGLEHPGIVPVYGLGHFEDGRPFYAMRFIKGENLRRALRKFHGLPLEDEDPKLAETELLPESTRSSSASRSDQPVTSASLFDRKRLEFRELLGRFVDVCQALAYAHDRKVLHRDLKPGNIMLGKYGETLVVDWGLAKTLGRKEELTPFDPRLAFDGPVIPTSGSDLHLTRGNAPAGQTPLIGTLGYISPEQAAGKLEELGTATDIFSLGATLFELLTGQPPIGAVLPGTTAKRRTQKEVEEAACKGDFLHPRQLLPEVPAPLEAVCLKAMSFQPQDRYPTAKALAEDIERWLADEPVAVWPEPITIRARRWMKRHQIAVATTAAAVLMAVIGLGVLAGVTSQHNIDLTDANSKKDEQTKLANKRADDLTKANDEITATLARSNFFLAVSRWEQGRLAEANDLLDLVPEQHRNWEWYYSKRQFAGSDVTLYGHAAKVTCTAYSPDGRWVASTSWDHTIKLWDAATGAEVRTFTGHTEPVLSVSFSPDGTQLASASFDKTIKLWDAHNGEELRTFSGHTNKLRCVNFSPDGKQLASASDDESIKVWDVNSGNELRTLPRQTGNVTSVSFSPDGQWLASASESSAEPGQIKLWDARSGEEIRTLRDGAMALSFSPDGQQLVSASGNEIQLWDARSGEKLRTLTGHAKRVRSVGFSQDGQRVVSASEDQTIKLWNARSGKVLSTLIGHSLPVLWAHFSPDSQRIASASWDNTVKLWDARSGREIRTLWGHSGVVTSVNFSRDGQRLASASQARKEYISDEVRRSGLDEIKVWDQHSGTEIHSITGHTAGVTCVSFSPDGEKLASASGEGSYNGSVGEIKLWDTRSGIELRTLTGHIASGDEYRFQPRRPATRIGESRQDSQTLGRAQRCRASHAHWKCRSGHERQF